MGFFTINICKVIKMRNRILSLILTILVLLSAVGNAFAESKDTKHDKDIEDVLFGPMGAPCNEDALDILQWAAYFAMDCIGKENPNEQTALNKLRKYGITGVPKTVGEFHYEGHKFENSHHERYTHKGWSDQLYGTDSADIARWVSVRKPMLVDTFIRVFTAGQKRWWEPVDIFGFFRPKVDETVRKQCESLAAIVYYTHILGDHCYNTRNTLLDRIPLVRAHVSESNPDLLNELEIHFAILFRSQTKSSQYQSLINDIDQIREQWSVNVGTYDITTDEQYAAYQGEARKLMKLLKEKVHLLLKNEEFFAKVFYASNS